MNWNTARNIQKGSIQYGASAELEVEQAVSALKKKIKPFILSLGSEVSDRTILITTLTQELKNIEELERSRLTELVSFAYDYALNQTLRVDYGVYAINYNLAIGYSANWLHDSKTGEMRISANMTALISELQGLIIGFQGDNNIILMGLVFDLLKKLVNQYKTLIRTELQAAWSQGARDAYLMEGCFYAVIENNDPCDKICAPNVGAHPVSLHGELGVDLPPYHPNCQCIFKGIFRKLY